MTFLCLVTLPHEAKKQTLHEIYQDTCLFVITYGSKVLIQQQHFVHHIVEYQVGYIEVYEEFYGRTAVKK